VYLVGPPSNTSIEGCQLGIQLVPYGFVSTPSECPFDLRLKADVGARFFIRAMIATSLTNRIDSQARFSKLQTEFYISIEVCPQP
jgi:hypothetical protein